MYEYAPFNIYPGSLKQAVDRHGQSLLDNLSTGSPWLELVDQIDEPARNNSPYYGPATQFLIDVFLDIADSNPELAEVRRTPFGRHIAAAHLIKNYLGGLLVGENGLITSLYAQCDISRTAAHTNRFRYLMHDTEHVLTGAWVPFNDVALVSGGAYQRLVNDGTSQVEAIDRLVGSEDLHIIAAVQGAKTLEVYKQLGRGYLSAESFTVDDDGLVSFTKPALDVITRYLEGPGCPTGKIQTTGGSLFATYWERINRFVLEGVDTREMRKEFN
ncbi:MAG: hypothetical protein AAF413_03370 [Patescibacteria group bacterium]